MRRMFLVLGLTGLLLFVAGPVWAQGDPLQQHFVPPEVIMQHQKELGITDSQREEIKQRVSEAQVRFTELQWDMQAHVGDLSELLADPAAEESQVLQRLDKVLATEAQIKRAQVSMLVGLRKILTPEQLEEARRLRGGMTGLQQHLGKLEKEMRRVQEEMVNVEKTDAKASTRAGGRGAARAAEGTRASRRTLR